MYTENYEYEIDLKDLMFAVLYKWRLLLLVAVVAAVLAGGYKAFSRSETPEMNVSVEMDAEMIKEQYEDQKSAYENSIESLRAIIDEQTQYILNSLLMRTDPYNKNVSSAKLMLEIEDSTGGSAGSLLELYKYALSDGEYIDEIADKSGIEQKYIKELIQISTSVPESRGVLVSGPVAENGFIHLSVTGPDTEITEMILSEMVQQAEKLHTDLSGSIKNHKLSVFRQNTVQMMDTALMDTQQGHRNNLISYQKNLADMEKNLKDMKLPEIEVSVGGSSMKTVAKYIIIGFLAGGFLSVCGVCAVYIMGDKVTSDKEVISRYRLKTLGTFSEIYRKKPLDFIDAWLRRLAGVGKVWPEDAVLEMIATNVENYAEGRDKLFITGLASQELMDKVAAYLTKALPHISFMTEGDMIMNASARKKMAECEGIILVEERRVSRYSMIQQELELAGNVKKDIIGVIVG